MKHINAVGPTPTPITPKIIPEYDARKTPVDVVRRRFMRWTAALVQNADNKCCYTLQCGDKYSAIGVLVRCWQLATNQYESLSLPLLDGIHNYRGVYDWLGYSEGANTTTINRLLLEVSWLNCCEHKNLKDIAAFVNDHFENEIAVDLETTRI